LEEDNLGAFWDVNSNSGDAFGFSDESEDFLVKVDVELVVLWMSDDQGSLKSSFGVFNFLDPLLSPKVLIGEQSVTNLVIVLDSLLGFLLLDQFLWELLHWSRDSEEQMS